MVAKTCFVMTIRIFIEASWKVDQLKVYSRATSMGGLQLFPPKAFFTVADNSSMMYAYVGYSGQ